MNTNPDQLLDLRADGHLALLSFETHEGSKLTRRFISELTTLLTAGARKPLICSTDRQLLAIFKATVSHSELKAENGNAFRVGLKFADVKDPRTITLTMDSETIPQGGTWADKSSPASVYRHELPCFDIAVMSRELRDFLDRWETAGDLVPPQSAEELRAQFKATQPKIATVAEQAQEFIDFDFESLDLNNPMRQGPLIAEVRRLREVRAAEHAQAERVSQGAWRARFFGMSGG
jgi:hypothetical protein